MANSQPYYQISVAVASGGKAPYRQMPNGCVRRTCGVMLRFQRLAIVALTSFLLVSAARSASPRDQLLSLVPPDIGFCLVVSDLREHAEKIQASGWFKKLKESAFVKGLAQSAEAKKLANLDLYLQKHLKTTSARLRDDIFGDAFLLAYRPGGPKEPEKEQGLVLLLARDAKLLSRLVDGVNGDLKQLQKRTHGKSTYYRRVENKGAANYYFLKGPLLAFSTQEAMIKQVIARHTDKSETENKPPATLGQELRRLNVNSALAALWFNPRAFDNHVKLILSEAKGSQADALKKFETYWRAIDGVALGITIQKNLELSLSIRATADKLPASARPFFTQPTKPSELWNRFPNHSLLALAGRVDAVALAQVLGDMLPPEIRKAVNSGLKRGVEAALGLDVQKDILPNLGPDWGFCLTTPEDKNALFPQLTWAVRVRPGNKKTTVGQGIINGLNSMALLAVLGYNSSGREDSLQLKTVSQGKIEVKYLENDKLFPKGFQPAYALKDGYLLLATSPDGIKRFGNQSSASLLAQGEVPLMRISLGGWANFVRERRQAFARHLAAVDGMPRKKADQQLQNLTWGLDLFDHIEMTQRTGGGLATWKLKIISKK